jgi:polysulfide reductase chain C
VLCVLPSAPSHGLGQALILVGGLTLRFLVVYSDDRAELPGEGEYYARLPERDAPFLRAWE